MKITLAASCLLIGIVVCAVSEGTAQSERSLPNPVLHFVGQQNYSSGGKSLVRYRYGVSNSSAYPDAMFAPAPDLPPCGTNTKSSRTWVDVFDQRGKRLYGFCAFRSHDDLNSIWFALPEGETPPSWVYIEMTDRQTNTKYKSNLAETTN